MRVKIGDTWYEPSSGVPIMIELTEGDKRNIAKMRPDATKYAVFHDDDLSTNEQKLNWMHDALEYPK